METKAIYKITNKVNGKIYIGQTNNPERRFSEHIHGYSSCKNSLIHRAINKYGVNNFIFETIGWFENWREKEQDFIELYHCLAPNGYNIIPGGNDPPHYSGEKNNYAKITNETAARVQEQLQDWSIPGKQIIKTNKITNDIFRHINEGSSWHRDDLSYPLRPSESELNELRADKVIDLLQNSTLSQREIGQQVGWNRSAVTMINIGKNHHRDNIDYPIRKIQNNKTCNDYSH